MSKHLKVGGAISAGFFAFVALTIGLPLLAVMGMAGSAHPDTGGVRADRMPAAAAVAYQRASDAARNFSPPCEIPTWILAGVGKVESSHGTFGGATIAPDGNVSPHIIGPPLPNLGGDTDNGRWDGSTTVDHAVGPMQFIP